MRSAKRKPQPKPQPQPRAAPASAPEPATRPGIEPQTEALAALAALPESVAAPEPTLGELLNLTGAAFELESEPDLPGFEMSDAPLPTPLAKAMEEHDVAATPAAAAPAATAHAAARVGPHSPDNPARGRRRPADAPAPVRGGARARGEAPLDGELVPATAASRYESRIRILDAWQYPGNVAAAPGYVDRNWVGWGDYDDVRKIGAGPCLRVPLTPDPDERVVVLCRIGDYVVHEEIVGDDGLSRIKVEVWEKGQFERLFLPAARP